MTRERVTKGRVSILENGDAAYPRMLSAIRLAERRVLLSTYQMDNDTIGRLFVKELKGALGRGVQVRLILDFLGDLVGGQPSARLLRSANIPFRSFGHLGKLGSINHRYHRKMLVIDSRIAFVGSLNVRERHLLERASDQGTSDLHFELTGDVAQEIERVFVADWIEVAAEDLSGTPLPIIGGPNSVPGDAVDMLIVTGDPHRGDRGVRRKYEAAIAAARNTLTILTPYFAPGPLLVDLVSCLDRGVEVKIAVPAKGNCLIDALAEEDLRLIVSPRPTPSRPRHGG